MGERLLNEGIFRSFAVSNIAYSVGVMLVGNIYIHFIHSFVLTKLSIGIANLIFLSILCLLIKMQNSKSSISHVTIKE